MYNHIYGQGNPNMHAGSKQYFKEKYYYDENSNMKYVQNNIGVIGHSYDDENHLVAKGYSTFEYDANGNMLKHNSADQNDHGTYYTYNAENRLVKVMTPVDRQQRHQRLAEYSYDALGRKISRFKYETNNNNTQMQDYSVYRYTAVGLDITGKADYKANGQNFRFDNEREYLYAMDNPIAQKEVDQNGYKRNDRNRYMYHDALGSVTNIYTQHSHIEEVRYGAWGEFLDSYHGNGNTEEYTNSGVLFGYTSKSFDSFTKLYNYGYRHLSTDRRAWMTQDPIRDGKNWNTYLGGVADPVNYIDLLGMYSIKVYFAKDRSKNGIAFLLDDNGKYVGHFDVKGQSAYGKSMKEKDGDTPTGTYRITGFFPNLFGPTFELDRIGGLVLKLKLGGVRGDGITWHALTDGLGVNFLSRTKGCMDSYGNTLRKLFKYIKTQRKVGTTVLPKTDKRPYELKYSSIETDLSKDKNDGLVIVKEVSDRQLKKFKELAKKIDSNKGKVKNYFNCEK